MKELLFHRLAQKKVGKTDCEVGNEHVELGLCKTYTGEESSRLDILCLMSVGD